jgi:hypothetical protein
VGFEPTRRLYTAYAISNRAPSANSDTSPKETDGSLPESESTAFSRNQKRDLDALLALLHFGGALLLGGAGRIAQGEGAKEY